MGMSAAERQAKYKATSKGKIVNARLEANRRAKLSGQDINPLTNKKYTISSKVQSRDLQRLVETQAGTEDAMRNRKTRLENAARRAEQTGTPRPAKPNPLRGGHGTRLTSEGGHFPTPQSKGGPTKEGAYLRQSKQANRNQGGRTFREWAMREASKGRVPNPARPSEMIKAPNPKIMTPNPSGAGAKAGTLTGRSWMFNIGTKIK